MHTRPAISQPPPTVETGRRAFIRQARTEGPGQRRRGQLGTRSSCGPRNQGRPPCCSGTPPGAVCSARRCWSAPAAPLQATVMSFAPIASPGRAHRRLTCTELAQMQAGTDRDTYNAAADETPGAPRVSHFAASHLERREGAPASIFRPSRRAETASVFAPFSSLGSVVRASKNCWMIRHHARPACLRIRQHCGPATKTVRLKIASDFTFHHDID